MPGSPAIPFDRASAGAIITIGVITTAFPEQPRVVLARTVGRRLGLIGALIDADLEDKRDKSFSSLMARDVFLQRLTAALQAQGYGVAPAPALRPDNHHFLASYPPGAADQPIDAYPDPIVGAYGYIAAGLQNSAPYRPIFIVSARLTRASDKTVLTQDAVVYNPLNPNDRVVTIAPDPA